MHSKRIFDGNANAIGTFNLSESIQNFRVLIFTVCSASGEYFTSIIPVASIVTELQTFFLSSSVVGGSDLLYNSGISIRFPNDMSFAIITQYHKEWTTPAIAAIDAL